TGGVPDGWMPPTTSMYGGTQMDARPGSFVQRQLSPNQMTMQMDPMAAPTTVGGMAASGGASIPTTGIQHQAFSSPAHGDSMPSDDQIIDAVRRLLIDADLSTTTKKVIRGQLAQEFGVDLSLKKEFISKVIDEMLIGGA
ncbi:hypothetical protein LPJ72_006099, partial [Coemansia sp. Benny D160-2]